MSLAEFKELKTRVLAIEKALECDPNLDQERKRALIEIKDGWVPMSDHLEGKMSKGQLLVRKKGEEKPHVLLTKEAYEIAKEMFDQETMRQQGGE